MKQIESKILQCFDQQNIRDLTIEEAQEQFLTLISSYKYTFGSYFIVRRKPLQGMLMIGKKNIITGLNPQLQNAGNITGRKKFTEELRKLHKKKHAKKNLSKFSPKSSDSSSNEDSSNSITSSEGKDRRINVEFDDVDD